ncbi:hypothetical protein CDL15_Pgr022097 [Punica granatum]|uniref:SAM-dependent MTase RsmB/NOP-type domain-containing protein n=1 Tax=Punica granatum TaxID=22663 RepID=A0A218VTW2_PUNGR|nr:hypothetical protein CDL15_Pgr022097 [Punica granatum]
MARGKPPSAASGRSVPRQLRGAERSAYFARREAAKVLRKVLEGDSRRQAVGSIKSLVYSPSVRNKKATFALVCQTLKYLPIIKNVLKSAQVLNGKLKRQLELVYIVAYDVLFRQATSTVGEPEKFLVLRRDALQSALQKLLTKKRVKCVDDLTVLYRTPDMLKPRYVRVNTLKLDVQSAILELGKHVKVEKDGLVPDLLMLPPNTDLHDHPLVLNGSIFMQGKASSMVAAALDPEPDWDVLDACSAPGNKTVHLAALMRGKGKIIACELNEERLTRLNHTISLSGASSILLMGSSCCIRRWFCALQIRAILLDPSCSGSGTTANRLDHLLPSYNASDTVDTDRLNKLAAFQKKALSHALTFPAVERVVYSTCSIHQIENEDVVESVLPLATSLGFRLSTPFPKWNGRGLPAFDGSENLLRTDPVEDKEGFFIALFIRKSSGNKLHCQDGAGDFAGTRRTSHNGNTHSTRTKVASSTGRYIRFPYLLTRLSKMSLYHSIQRKRTA